MRVVRTFLAVLWAVLVLFLIGLAGWFLFGHHLSVSGVDSRTLLDWVMGICCFFWLILILKAPWDLYFQAHEALFEMERSRERGIAVPPGREEYVRKLQRRLLWLAVGAHVFSSMLVVGVAWWSHGVVGYYFGVFYLVSTGFRPAVAGYVYLSQKLRSINQEVRYPREDVVEIRQKLRWLEEAARTGTGQDVRERPSDHVIYAAVGALPGRMTAAEAALGREAAAREGDVRELRMRLHALGREFETTLSRVTDNQEVIRGVQAFVRLISQSAQT